MSPEMLLSPEFWTNIYRSGRVGTYDANLLVALVARLIVVCLLMLLARVVIGMIKHFIHLGLNSAIATSGKENRRIGTLETLLYSAITYTIYFVTFILMLFTIGITWAGLAPLIGAASVMGLAIGFGAQKLVRDIITGLFILGEGQFDVGDHVTIGTVTGIVQEMGLRVTQLCDEDGRIYTIANGDISQVFNASRRDIRQQIDINIKNESAIKAAVEVMHSVALIALKDRPMPATPPDVTIISMEAAKITLRLTIWMPVKLAGEVKQRVCERLMSALVEAGVEVA